MSNKTPPRPPVRGWAPCGLEGCMYCDEVYRYRAAMAAKEETKP